MHSAHPDAPSSFVMCTIRIESRLHRSTPLRPRLLLITKLSTACFRVQVLIPTAVSTRLSAVRTVELAGINDSPLNSPLHGAVCDDERGNKVEDLVPRAANDVPEALCEKVGHGSLSVRAEGVGNDALARAAAALVRVTP